MCLSFTRLKVLTRALGILFALLLSSFGAHAQRVNFESVVDPGFNFMRSWVDINNDGKDDYCVFVGNNADGLDCYLSNGNGFQSARVIYAIGSYAMGNPFWWTDVNGDGQVDLCRLMDRILPVNGGSTATVQCRMGPNFTSAVNATVPIFAWNTSCPQFDSCDGIPVPGVYDARDLFVADVNQDGRSDLCYLQTGDVYTSSYELRCLTFNGTAFSAAASPTLIRAIGSPGNRDYPRGFFDVNGDGYPDFCRLQSGIYCVLGSVNGFASTGTMDVAMPPISKDGVAFVDINADGKTDLCRVNESPNYLACRLSTGKAWEATDRISVEFTGSSNATSRWWADINGDGLPDFCRAAGPDPNAGTNMSNLWCRLTRGGDTTTGMFAPQEIQFDGNGSVGALHFGRSDGGRSFCDPFGTGIQTFCRATYRETSTGQQCYEGAEGPICYNTVALSHGIAIGVYGGLNVTSVSSDEIQARPALVTAYTDGLGAESRVTYMPLSSTLVYGRSGVGSAFPRVQIAQPRSPVVFETRAWGTGSSTTLTGNARYFYKDLRVDNQSGSRGFRERWFLTEGSNTLEHTIYFQGLGPTVDASSINASATDPALAVKGLLEIGQPKEKRVYAIDPFRIPADIAGWTPPPGANPRQKKLAATMRQASTLPGAMSTTAVSPPTDANPFMLLKRSTSTLGDTVPASTRFRPVVATRTEAWDWNDRTAVALPVVDGSSVTTDMGNITSLVETTTHVSQVWQKTTTNTYADNATNWLLGRLTQTSVTSTAPSAATQLAANATSYGTSPNANTTSAVPATVVTLSAPAIANTQAGQTSTADAVLTNSAGYPLVIVPPTASSVTGQSLSFVSTTCGPQLAANATCAVTVRFAPTTAATTPGTVSVDTASGPRVVAFNATSLASFSTATLTGTAPNLGTVWYGTSPAPTATATIRNDGNSPMTLTGLSGLSTRFQLSANTCTSVAAGASCSMTLSMPTSTAGSTPSAVATVGATNNASFSIAGTVNSAVSRWSVTTLAFGSLTTGQSSTQSLTLFNDGFGLPAGWNAALTNLPAGFTANTSACASVNPGASCNVSITFAPTAGLAYSGSGIRPATVSYTNNVLAVSGTGVLPATTLTASPSSLSFGTALPRGAYATKSVTVTNSGTVAATNFGYAITSGGGFPGYSVARGTCPVAGGTLAAGSSCTLSVTFEASCAIGTFTGNLRISSANLATPINVPLSAGVKGTGICNA